LSQEKIKMFCKLCHVGIYKPGDIINLQSGGVLLRGGCTELAQNVEVFDDDASDATSFAAKSKGIK